MPVKFHETKTLSNIQTVLLELKSVLKTQYRVTTLGIFGSYSRNKQHQDSSPLAK